MSTKTPAKAKYKLSGELLAAAYKKSSDERVKFAVVLAGVLILAGIAYFSLALMWTKFSRAEVFFAECMREMLQTDTLVTPLYHGTPFFDKPILSYWTIATSYKLFGISHFAARIPSVLAALGTILACGLGTRFLYGTRAGSLAAAILASSFMFLSFATLCMSDMTLVFFDTLSLGLLYTACSNERHRNSLFWLAALSMGLAFLTKGPVGIVLPAISFMSYLTLSRQWRVVQFKKHILPGALIAALAASPWFIAAYQENGASALSYFFIRENLQRFAGSTYDTHKPIWFMVLSLCSGFLPWSVFLPFALKKSLAAWQLDFHSEDSKKQLFLWLWIATVIGFFSLSRGKIDYYALPVYPACAILVAGYLSEAIDQKRKPAAILAWVFAGIFLVAGISTFIALPNVMTEPDFKKWILIPAALSSSGLLIFACAFTNQLRKAYKMIFVSICLTAIGFALQIYPWITSKQAVLAYIPTIQSVSYETRIGVYKSIENWIDEITFQTDKEPLNIKNEQMAAQFLKGGAHSILLIPEKEYKNLPQPIQAKCRILATRPFIKHSLTPSNLLNFSKKAPDSSSLLLITN